MKVILIEPTMEDKISFSSCRDRNDHFGYLGSVEHGERARNSNRCRSKYAENGSLGAAGNAGTSRINEAILEQ
ncbi:hypothetical protein D3C85_1403100 [compost metagenome]